MESENGANQDDIVTLLRDVGHEVEVTRAKVEIQRRDLVGTGLEHKVPSTEHLCEIAALMANAADEIERLRRCLKEIGNSVHKAIQHARD